MFKLIFSLSSLSFVGYAIGFINQTIIAKRFGTSAELDSYLIALSVVNFGWLFIGPVNEISIPNFFKESKLSNENGSIYFSRVLNIILLFSIITSFLIYFFLPFIFSHVSSGSKIEYIQFKINILILLPIIFLTAITQYFQVVLNSMSKYIAQSIGKIVTATISVIFLLLTFDVLGIKAIIFGMEFGLITLSLLQFYFIFKHKIYYQPFSGVLIDKLFYKNIIALLLTYLLSALQLVYEKFVFMSFGNGVLSSYNYSQALYQIPQMIVTTGVLAIVSTDFMNKIHENEIDDGLNKLYDIAINSFNIAMLVAITISIYSKEIVYILFFRGNFNIDSFEKTSSILCLLIFALPFLVLGSILGRALVALKKVKILTWINIFSSVTSIFFLYFSYINKNITFGILSIILVHLIVVIYKIIKYQSFYLESNIKSNIFNLNFIKRFFILLFYCIILLSLKYFLDISINVNKLVLIKELLFAGLIFSITVAVYFKLLKIKPYEKAIFINK